PPPPLTEIGLVTPIDSPVAPPTPEAPAPAPQAEVQATPPATEAPAPVTTPVTAAPALDDDVDPDLPPSSSAPSSLRLKSDAPKIATAPFARTNQAYDQRATPAGDVLAREDYGTYFQQLNSSLDAGKPLAYVVNTILPVRDVSKIPAMIWSVVTGLQDPAGATGRVGFVFGVNTKASADESESRLAEIDDAITELRDSDAMRPFADYPIAFVASTFEDKFPAGTMRNEVLNSPATLDLLAGFLDAGHHPYVSVQDSDASSRLVSPTGPHVFDHFETLLAPADQHVQTYLDTLSPASPIDGPQSPTGSDVDMTVDEAAAQPDPPFRPLMMAGGYRPDDLQAQLDAARNDPGVDEDVAEELNDLAANPDKITAAIDKVRADMAARRAQAKVHPLLPYAPEPNLFLDGLAVMVDTELQFGPRGAEFDHLAKQLTTFAAGELHQSFAAAHAEAEVDLPVPVSTDTATVDVPMAQDQTDIHESVAVHGGSTTLPIRGPAFVVDFVDGAVSTDLLRLARGLLHSSALGQSHAAPSHPGDRFFDSKKARAGTSFAAVADRAGLNDTEAADNYYQTSEPLRPIRHDDTEADSTVPDVSKKDKKDLGKNKGNKISGALAQPVAPWAGQESETPFADVTFGVDPRHKDRAAYESVAGNPAGTDQRMQRYRDNELDAESDEMDTDTAQDTVVDLTDQLDDVALGSKRRREETGSPEPDAAPPPAKRREMLPPAESSAPGKTPGPATEPETVKNTGHLLGDAAQPESTWASRAADVKPARISTERFDPGTGGRRNGPTPTGGMAPDNLTIDKHGPGWLDGALTHIASDVRRVQADDGAWVQEHTVRLEIGAFDPSVRSAQQGAPDGSTPSSPADVAAVREAAARAVDEHLNGKYQLPNGDQLHVRVEFVDPPAPGGSHPADAQPHASVWVHNGTDDARQFHWPVDAVTSGESGVFAHEVLHFLGAADTYHDREMLFRRPPAGPDARVPTALTDNPHDTGPGLMGRAARGPAPVLTPGDLDRIHQATQSAVRVPEAPVNGPTPPTTDSPAAQEQEPTPADRGPETAGKKEAADNEEDLDLPPSSAAPSTSRPETETAQQTVVRDLLTDPQRLPGITVMIDEAMNFGHQTAGISLIESLRKLGYDRDVTVVASPGVWTKVDKLLPPGTPGITRVTQDEFLASPATRYSDQRTPGAPNRLVLVGASDTIDTSNADSFLNYMGADQAVVFQPYAWKNGSRLAFSRTGPGATATVTDLNQGTIPADAIFNTDMPALDTATATATIRTAHGDSNLGDALVTVATAALDDTIDVMPVYGLHRLDKELRPGAGMALAHGVHAAGLGRPAVILEISESDVDFSPPRDANQTPSWLSTVDLRAGEPLTLDGLNPGDVVVVRTGPLRKDVFQTAYQLGSLPAVLEGANTANLVQLLDRPYFSPRPEDTGFPNSGDPADAGQITALTAVADAIRMDSDWSTALKAEQKGPYQNIATIATATSVLTSRSQAVVDYPGEEDFLLGDEFDRLRDALPSRLDEVVAIFGGSPEAVAAAQPVTGMTQKQKMAALERQIPVTEDQIQQLHALLDDERANLVNQVRDRYQHHSTDPSPESVTAIATAINDLHTSDSALKQYFDRVAASARDPRRDQVLQGLSHFAANQPGATVGSQSATSSHTEAEDQLRDTDYPFLLDVNPLRDQGGELTTNCYVAAIATDMSLASGGIDRFQAGGAVASPSEFLANYAGRPLDTVRDLDQVRDILTAAGPGARGIVTVQRMDGTGHAFNVVHDHNGVVFLDGQAGHFAALDPAYPRISLVSTGDREFPSAGLETPAAPGPLVGTLSGGVPDFGKTFDGTSMGVEIELSGVSTSLDGSSTRAFGYVASTDDTPLVMITKDMSTGDHPSRKNWKTHTLELVTYPVEVSSDAGVEQRKRAVLTLLDHLDTHLATGGGPLTSADLGHGLQLVVTNKNHEITSGSLDTDRPGTKIAMPVSMQQVTVGIRASDVTTSDDPVAVAVRKAPWYDDSHTGTAQSMLATAPPPAGVDVEQVTGAYTYVMSVIGFVAQLVNDNKMSIGDYYPADSTSTSLTDPKIKNAWAVLPRTKPIKMVHWLPAAEKAATLKLIRETPPPADANAEAWRAARAYIVSQQGDVAGHGIDDAVIGGEPAVLFEHRTITPDVAAFVPSRPEQVVVITDPASTFGDNRKTAVARAGTEVSSPQNATDFANWMRTKVSEARARTASDAALIAQSAVNQKMQWLAENRPQTWQAMLAELAPQTRPAPASTTTGPRTAGQRPETVATPVTADEIATLRDTTAPRTANTTSFDVVELTPTRTGVPDLVADSYRQAGLPVPETSRPVINLGRIDGPVAYDHRLLSTD
ncbi:actin cross-linking domain-containing toxin, partial [Actinoplanes awajinensis]|uniref:actin cross-linking domain-containing toxin n=1 Tax=Actinoplanes awajinensis TaxID=135946 RepID=UPI0012FCF265